MDRRWPAWAALWSTWTIATLWLVSAREAWWVLSGKDLGYGGQPVEPVVGLAVLVLGTVLAACFLLTAVSWARWPGAMRASLALSGVALLASAAVWPAVPTTGPLYVVGTAAAGVIALVAAATRPGEGTSPEEAAAPGRAWVARIALLVAGVVVVAGGLRGMAYWQWMIGLDQAHYVLAVAMGAAMVVAALVGPALRRRERGWRWPVVAVLVPLALASLAVGVIVLGETATLWVPEEAETGWGMGTPLLLIGAGLLSGAVAARRCWWQLAALSISSGVLVGVLAVVRDATIRHLV